MHTSSTRSAAKRTIHQDKVGFHQRQHIVMYGLAGLQSLTPVFRDPFARTEVILPETNSASTSISPLQEEEDSSFPRSIDSSSFSSASNTPEDSLYSREDEPTATATTSEGSISSLTQTSIWDKQRECLDDEHHGQIIPKQKEPAIAEQYRTISPKQSIVSTPSEAAQQDAEKPYTSMQVQRENINYQVVRKDQMPDINILEAMLKKSPDSVEVGQEMLMNEITSVNVLESTPHLLIHGKIYLESRKAIWRKCGKLKEVDVEAQTRTLPDLVHIDPWELPIDGASLMIPRSSEGNLGSGSEKTFEFPQYRVNATCNKCEKGQISCSRCEGLDAVDCFWCSSTGIYKGRQCKKCNATGQIRCVKCNNAAKVKCSTCDGKGAIKWAICVDVKMEQLVLPPITLEDLVLSTDFDGEDGMILDSESDMIRYKATQAIYEATLQIMEMSSSSDSKKDSIRMKKIPVFAECQVEKHSKRLIQIGQRQRLYPGIIQLSQFTHSTDNESFTRMPFTSIEAVQAESEYGNFTKEDHTSGNKVRQMSLPMLPEDPRKGQSPPRRASLAMSNGIDKMSAFFNTKRRGSMQ
jgi:hypothetical protein